MNTDRLLAAIPYPLTATAVVAWGVATLRTLAFFFPDTINPAPLSAALDLAGAAAVALGGPFLAAFVVWRKRLYRYAEDEFFGLWWRWEYGFFGGIQRLRPMCRVCKEPIHFHSGLARYLHSDNHLCEVCGHNTLSRTREVIPKKDVFGDVRSLIAQRRKQRKA